MAAPSQSEMRLVERTARIMATAISVHVACEPDRERQAAQAIESCLDWLRVVERRLTRFNPTSELCRLNAAAGQWRGVSRTLFMALEQSVAAAQASDGLFDPTLLPVLEQLGYDRDFKAIVEGDVGPEPPPELDLVEAGAWRAIQLDRERLRVCLPAGARLDLGGIAKGWAADVGLERCFSAFPNVLINVGGDMRVRGHGPGAEAWAIGIGNPREHLPGAEPHIAVVSLATGGMAGSSATDRRWRRGGERLHHLLDPRTLRPMRLWLDETDDGPEAETLIASATAFAPTGAHAEVAAKVALLRGYPEALRRVEEAWSTETATDAAVYGDANVALMLVMGNGQVHCSSNLSEWLASQGSGGELWLD
ncbi:MAG TPA: FAD:protein FMN transferase [Ktedonobacterales bacterium]|nr:FAD:protein FMN transferase [Ktedonobacterales bacterium]